MSQPRPDHGATQAAARDAATLMGETRTAALGTLDARSGHPYVSFVTAALDERGAPLLLLSRLARHTQNLERDPRASLLFTLADRAPGDPLAGARVTVLGRLVSTADPSARPCFLARHPESEMYAGFADFRFFALAIENAHFIGGFGRIIELSPADLAAASATP